MSRKLNVVSIGGGTGQSVVLRALAGIPDIDVTAIVGVTDNGGHSGELRRYFGIPQVGDIRNCVAALGRDDDLLTYLLRFRFSESGLRGTSLGNLIVLALMKMEGSLSRGIAKIAAELAIPHTITPVSDDSTNICALLENGRRIVGEWEIIRRRPRSPIARLYHQRKIEALPLCIRAIERADVVIFSPGALHTGIISVLLVRGVVPAIKSSRALTIGVCNVMTIPGMTDGYTTFDHFRLLSDSLKAVPDYFLTNTAVPPKHLLDLYRKDGSKIVRHCPAQWEGAGLIERDLVEMGGRDVLALYHRHPRRGMKAAPHFIRHDAVKLRKAFREIFATKPDHRKRPK